ncbi:MAG: cation:proton antiporter [Candidatus Riflebacteria bacterium]|nr:cation:proton antiporter [Candidatus Riflebacteria bacterium]
MLTVNAVAVIILLGGWAFARIFEKFKLPNVLGMVVFGIICSVTIKDRTPDLLWKIAPFLKSLALIIILLRAGLGLSRKTLRKSGKTTLFMAFVPCLFEGTALTVVFHYLFNFAWPVAGLTAFMLSAVSLAVVVPTMLDLKGRGYGNRNAVPTIALAGASVDNVVAITVFSAFLGMAKGGDIDVLQSIATIPLTIGAGIGVGAVVGFILVFWLEKKYRSIRATEKTLVLLAAGIFLAEVGDMFHVTALLGVMTVGYIVFEKSNQIAHEIAAKLSKIWVFAEIILFVLIGYSVDVNVAMSAGFKGLIAIGTGLIFRSIGVWLATSFSSLNRRERLFCVIAYLPKATVQAALGGVALANGLAEGQIVLAIAVLSIVITSPIGLFLIRHFSPKLLDLDI